MEYLHSGDMEKAEFLKKIYRTVTDVLADLRKDVLE